MNPYLITGPALISFSGGRTSAYMLKMILDTHGGTLPDDVHVTFANTGKEREETLRFVHECGTRWGVKVHWLEWRSRLKRTPVADRFEVVGFNSASRNGEPFAALIASKKATPNQEYRWCTEHLKVQVMHDFMLTLGFAPGSYQEAVGLRGDEMWRYFKMLERNERDQRQCIAPLVQAKVSKSDVMRFWAEQPFDLGLLPVEGNCDLCFMKGRNNLSALIRRRPESAAWWSEQESLTGTFSSRYSVDQLASDVARQPVMPGLEEFEEFDSECGLVCYHEDAA